MSEPLRVLVVEDDDDDWMFIRERVGIADRSSSLQDALIALRSRCYDVVVCDLGLPDSLPEQTVPVVRGEQPRVGIVVLTGHSEEETKRMATGQGAEEWLSKDVLRSNGRLVAAIERAAERAAELAPTRELLP